VAAGEDLSDFATRDYLLNLSLAAQTSEVACTKGGTEVNQGPSRRCNSKAVTLNNIVVE
jgi:hypothetical protein